MRKVEANKEGEKKEILFDRWQLDRISKKSRIDYLASIQMVENYIDEYPEDYMGYLLYVHMLLDVGRDEEAVDFYYRYLCDSYIDRDFQKSRDDSFLKFYYTKLKYLKARLLLAEEKYSQAYNLYSGLRDSSLVSVYLAKECGKEIPRVYTISNYLKQQILSYNDYRFLEHIQDHAYNEEDCNGCFVEDFDFYEIFKMIKALVPNQKRFSLNIYNDKYFFKYDSCGYFQNSLVNYFAVIALRNTNKFITMYPCDTTMNLPYIDLNEIKQESAEVRVLSQIDKFNKKYNIKEDA